jgi:hypothetical protein
MCPGVKSSRSDYVEIWRQPCPSGGSEEIINSIQLPEVHPHIWGLLPVPVIHMAGENARPPSNRDVAACPFGHTGLDFGFRQDSGKVTVCSNLGIDKVNAMWYTSNMLVRAMGPVVSSSRLVICRVMGVSNNLEVIGCRPVL